MTFEYFFMFLWSFDVNSFMISLFLSFKAIKAKKAAHLARNAKLDRWIDVFLKMLLQYPVAVFILPKRPIQAGKSNTTILKAKKDLEGQIFEGNTNKTKGTLVQERG